MWGMRGCLATLALYACTATRLQDVLKPAGRHGRCPSLYASAPPLTGRRYAQFS